MTTALKSPKSHGSTSGPEAVEQAYVDAWRSLARATTALASRLEYDFAEQDLPPLQWFEVLDGLVAAGNEPGSDGGEDFGVGLRMGELSELLPISKGGMTKLVDRIAAAGLVERRACATDRRVSYVGLTDAGRQMYEQMQPIYEAGISQHLAAHISADEAADLAAVLAPVRSSACTGVEAPCED